MKFLFALALLSELIKKAGIFIRNDPIFKPRTWTGMFLFHQGGDPMICVFLADCTVFSTNGNGALSPLLASVRKVEKRNMGSAIGL